MSEAEQIESAPQEKEVNPAVTEQPKEINTFIDFNKWDDVSPDQVRARLDKDTREKRAAQRESEALKKQLQERDSKLSELQKPKIVEAPNVDLAYSDEAEFKRLNQEHIDSNNRLSEWNANEQARQQSLQADAERAKQERQMNFLSRSQRAGLEENEIYAAANVAQNVLSEDVETHLMEHEYGPQILRQLAGNPLELQALASLSSIQAGVKLNEMAQAFQRNLTTNAPPPDDPLNGSGVSSKDDTYGGLLEGSQFE